MHSCSINSISVLKFNFLTQLNGSVSDLLTPGFTKVPKPSTSQSDSFTDDDESELSFQSTLTLNSSSSGDASDVFCSSQNKRTSTPIPPKVSCAPVSVQGKTSPDLPSDFIIPSKFGKITECYYDSYENLVWNQDKHFFSCWFALSLVCLTF